MPNDQELVHINLLFPLGLKTIDMAVKIVQSNVWLVRVKNTYFYKNTLHYNIVRDYIESISCIARYLTAGIYLVIQGSGRSKVNVRYHANVKGNFGRLSISYH